MQSRFKGLYDALPVFVQNSILTGYCAFLDHARYGGQFASFKAFLDKSQWFSAAQLRDFQESQFAKLMSYAYHHVPYYRRVMDERGLKPRDLQSLTDLKKLPVLTKRDIKTNFVELLSDEFNLRSVKKGHTSGTTGSPLEICYSDNLIHINYAVLDRQYAWANVRLKRFGDRIAIVRGNVIVPLHQTKPPFWRHNHLHNQLLLSSFHLSPQNLSFYIDKLTRFSPKALDGYPSTVYILAKYLKNIGRKFKMHAVFTSSETLFDFQRETIEESFDCKVYDYLGAAERVLFSAECDHHRGHHIADEFGITEVLDADHNALGPGETGVLVATSLHNYAMPMIRYVSNDMSSLKVEPCPCGRGLPLMEDVTTKSEDLLTLRDGRLISPSVLTHPFKPLTSIIESQVIQEDLDHVCIKLVAGSEFSSQDERSLVLGLKERLGQAVDVRVEKVDVLERTRTGKFKWVISKVKLGI